MLTFLALPLTGCVREVIVEKPVPVPVPGPTKWVDVPRNLVVIRNKTTLPETLSYGESLQLWSADRATIEALNGQLRAIQGLNDGDTE